MNINWLILSYRLVVLYGFYVTVQGVEFPLEIDELVIEMVSNPSEIDEWIMVTKSIPFISYDKSSNKHVRVIITRNETDKSFDVWTRSKTDSSASTQFELKGDEFVFAFQIRELYSFVMNIFAGYCYTSFDKHPRFVRMVIGSRSIAKKFRYDEIFLKTNLADLDTIKSLGTTPHGLFAGLSFYYALSHVLIYINGEVKILTRSAILDTIVTENNEGILCRQFLIHPPNDDNYHNSDILFSAQLINTASTCTENRVVLSIWISNEIPVHICLIFSDSVEQAGKFHRKISSFVNPDLIIDDSQANSLFNADLENIADVPNN